MIAEGQAAGRMPPPPLPPAPPSPPPAAAAAAAEVSDDEDEDATKAPIVKNYTRRSAKAQQAALTSKHVVSPITGEFIPINEMAEHMRISLLDLRWREQRDAALSKIKETTKASDEDVWRHLTMLANKRPEVFTSKEEMNSVMVEQIEEERAGQGVDGGDEEKEEEEEEEQKRKRPRWGGE
jgi:splicing factor 3A subunit 1